MDEPVHDPLHVYAREYASSLAGITQKLIRWNDIVQVAKDFYPNDIQAGIRECLHSCVPDDPQFDGKNILAVSLRANYGWMIRP